MHSSDTHVFLFTVPRSHLRSGDEHGGLEGGSGSRLGEEAGLKADTKVGVLFFCPKIQIEWQKTWAAEEAYSQEQEGDQLEYQAYSSAIIPFLPGLDLALSGVAAGSVVAPSQHMLSIGQPLAIQNTPVTGVAELQVQLYKLTKQVIPSVKRYRRWSRHCRVQRHAFPHRYTSSWNSSKGQKESRWSWRL